MHGAFNYKDASGQARRRSIDALIQWFIDDVFLDSVIYTCQFRYVSVPSCLHSWFYQAGGTRGEKRGMGGQSSSWKRAHPSEVGVHWGHSSNESINQWINESMNEWNSRALSPPAPTAAVQGLQAASKVDVSGAPKVRSPSKDLPGIF